MYKPKHESKFKNIKTIGSFKGEMVSYDSKKEYQRATELLLLEKNGKITNLKRQVPYILIDKSKWGRAIKYIADFTYYENGELVVEDVKSDFTRKDKVYQLKKRLMKERYQISISEKV